MVFLVKQKDMKGKQHKGARNLVDFDGVYPGFAKKEMVLSFLA